jgi:hypothetical protein
MARVFVFSEFGSLTTPSVEEVGEHLPPTAKIIAYNVQYPEMPHYYMVAFDTFDEVYDLWCHQKENDIPIYLEVDGKWRLRS